MLCRSFQGKGTKISGFAVKYHGSFPFFQVDETIAHIRSSIQYLGKGDAHFSESPMLHLFPGRHDRYKCRDAMIEFDVYEYFPSLFVGIVLFEIVSRWKACFSA